MKMVTDLEWQCYLPYVEDLLETPAVQSMRTLPHHLTVSCYEHSVFVSYVAFRLARRMKLDIRAAARGGLLHDLYLYRWNDRTAHPGSQCLDHPEFALRNARRLTQLSPKEENIIVSHMWPLAVHFPHSREAWVVSVADKLCATAELLGYWKRSSVRRLALHTA